MDERKYVKQVVKHLKCSGAKREEVRRELLADIASAVEAGESWDQVRARMGMPKEAAREFNDNFSAEERKKYRNKRILIISGIVAALLAVLAAVGYWMFHKVSSLNEKSGFNEALVVEKAKEIIDLFDRGDYAAIIAGGSEKMQAGLNEEILSQAKDTICDDWGSFRSYGTPYTAFVNQMGAEGALVQINVAYENISVTYTISFDRDMKLQGFFIK